MKTRILFFLGLCLVALTTRSAAAKPAAFLRTDGAKFYVAVKVDPSLWNGMDGTATPLSRAEVLREVQASVYQEGKQISTTVEGPDSFGADFTIPISNADKILKGDFAALTLAVQRYPISKGTYSGFSINVKTEVKTSLTLQSGQCFDGFPLLVELNEDVVPSAYTLQRLEKLLTYMRKVNPLTQVESATAEKAEPPRQLKPTPFFDKLVKEHRFIACFTLAKDPPSGTFDIKFTYPEDAELELRHPFLKTDVENASHTVTPFSLDEGNVGKRAIEQNLDIGVQYGSEVSDKKEKDAAGMEITVRRRDSKGTLDLRLAPLLNALSLPDPGSNTFKFLTPFLIDARVSTGKINEDTLSLNRIVLGSEFEIRHYTDPSTFPTFQRYIFSFRNASDRDFKQAEWKANFEFQPVFSILNHPLRFRRRSFDRELDPDPDRAPKDFTTTIGFGRQFLPLLGVEVGKTWRNKSPFAAIEKTDFVRRFYFGGTLNLDLTAYVRVSVKDILYVRGEMKEDRLHNYFLGSIEAPFPSFTRNASSSAFFSFERGGQPPFATPDVNAIKVGYRVQWNGWFGKRR